MTTAISVKNLSVAYSNVEAISNITLDINEGDFVSVIGPNGGGKTTLLNTLLGFLDVNYGEVKILGKNVKSSDISISYVPQISAIDRNFPITVLETVMTAFLKSGLHPFRRFKPQEREKALSLLEQVGLSEYAARRISELSGGEFQRLLIARALAANPQILLLDEPTANVDVSSRDKIFNSLASLNKSGMTIVVVTHDLAAAVEYSTKLALINRTLHYYGEPIITEEIAKLMYGGRIV